MRFEISQCSNDGRWRWYLVGASGTVIAQGDSCPTRVAIFSAIHHIVGSRNVPIYERLTQEKEAHGSDRASHPIGAQSHTEARKMEPRA
jgi:uncharacterized protein YegP (UPF0339 family)